MANWLPNRCSQKLLLVLALLAIYGSCSLAAADGIRQSLPRKNAGLTKGTSVLSGLSLNVSTEWSGGYGYRPVTFVFTSPNRSKSDRSITIRFYVTSSRDDQATMRVEQDVDLSTGKQLSELSVIVPHFETWRFVWWDVFVDGVRDPYLSVDIENRIPHSNSFPTALSVLRFYNNRPTGAIGVAKRVQIRNQSLEVEELAVGVVEDWLNYTTFDAVACDVHILEQQKEQSPEGFETLLRWVAAGGSLWIEDLKDDFAELNQIDQLVSDNDWLAFNQATEEAENPLLQGKPKLPANWRWAELRKGRDEAEAIQLPSMNRQGLLEDEAEALLGKAPGGRNSKRELTAWFVERPFGFGRVVAFPSRWNMIPKKSEDEQVAAFGGYLSERAWSQRHGLTPSAANNGFSNLLIPGVGLAPVTLFRVLITLFALIVGPLNYWLLRRRQLAHLMVLTVPLAAGLVTLGLLGYALFADGFGTEVRVRSLAFIDQKANQQTTWSRLSYYAGMAPGEGMTFSDKTALYPILPGWNELGWADTQAAAREVYWREDQQRLKSGWLRSRSPTQYLQIRSDGCEKRINFAANAKQLSVSNQLGAKIQMLIVADKAGELWVAEDVPLEKSIQLRQEEKLELIKQFRRLVLDNEPTVPLGLGESADSELIDQQRRALRRELRDQNDLNYGTAEAGDSLLNGVIDQLVGLDGDTQPLALPPRSYVAICEQAVTTELGVATAREAGSFHVILGTW